MKRREMLRLSLTKAARILPLTLSVTGSLVRLVQVGAGVLQSQEVASFPAGNPNQADQSKDLIKEEA